MSIPIVIGIAFLVIGCLLLFLTAFFIAVAVVFARFPKKTAKTGAILQDALHKKNVTIYGSRRGGSINTMFFKHISKGYYIYTVEGKNYPIRQQYLMTTPRQVPKFVSVVYLKRCPRMAYIESDMVPSYEINAMISGVLTLMAFVFGIFMLIG